MRRLLIIGCGDVVRRALPVLLQRWRVFALVRRRDPALAALGVVQLVGDLDDARSLGRIAGIADAVLHSAPPPAEGEADPRTARLLAALAKGKSLPRSLVYIGTTGVYGDCGGALIDETRPVAPRTSRARRRADAERRLRNFGRRSGCRVVLLRAPGIYAADRLPLERIRNRTPLIRAEEDAYSNHIHADDLAGTCIAALHRGGPQRAVNVVDDSALAMGDWFDLLADAFALPRSPRLAKAEALAALSPVQLSFMGESRRIGNTRLKNELGVRLRYPTVAVGVAAALENNRGAS
ncbi:MAG: NAD-dependent epimerase/dehydratase family protein [Rhodocyclaceae bacterium]|nr:MAG: NAD-dependent epimerase/dehydratase family protein [Rhodocyclaceae bacterium]